MKRYQLVQARGGKKQAEIAELCGVAQQTYSHWECGRLTPSIKMMLILEKILCVPKEQLFPDIFDEQVAARESA